MSSEHEWHERVCCYSMSSEHVCVTRGCIVRGYEWHEKAGVLVGHLGTNKTPRLVLPIAMTPRGLGISPSSSLRSQ